MDREEFMHEFATLKTIHAAGGHPNIAGERYREWRQRP